MNCVYKLIFAEEVVTFREQFSLPQNEGLNLHLEDTYGTWIVSQESRQLTRLHKHITHPPIESYISTLTHDKSEVMYLMTNGHIININYNTSFDNFRVSFGSQTYSYEYRWEKS